MVVFRCRECGTDLTTRVDKLTDSSVLLDPWTTPLEEYAGKDYLPAGYYTVATSDETPHGGHVGHFILNNTDATNICLHENRKQTSGCCGLDGMDGPNILCENGHEVGTKRSDCWTLHYIALDPTLVSEFDS